MFLSLIGRSTFKTRSSMVVNTNIYLWKPCCYLSKGPDRWLPWEDELLKNYVAHNGKKWSEIVQHCLPTRSPIQCQSRWTDILNPDLKRGSFSKVERALLEKGVNELGEGNWSKICEHYLPQRSPRRIANEWLSVAKTGPKRWTEEEDLLLLKGLKEFGPSWTSISNHYLPLRTRVQIRSHYQSKLNPNLKREKWTEHELDLLLRRTIMFGQDWNKVAEGLPGRSPEKCSLVWLTQLDPALNKGPWTEEETRLFWERMSHGEGSFSKTAEELPGRNRLHCFHKFWKTVGQDTEFKLVYGDLLKKNEDENNFAWRIRVAKLVCDWLDKDISIRKSKNKSITFHQAGPWSEQDLLKLDELVQTQLKEKDKLDYSDWTKIATYFPEREVRQCKYQYEAHLSVKDIKKGYWTEEEDEQLLQLVKENGTDWDKIIEHIPNRTKRQCLYRWHRNLKFIYDGPPTIKSKQLTDTEKSLIKEGVQMFGPNWTAIRMTYLPSRTPNQIMRWWNSQPKNGIEEEYDGVNHKSFWSEDEDKALKFAVNKYQNENGEVLSWAKVAKVIQDRTPEQCRRRWMYSLDPNIKKGVWTYDEEMQLLEIVQKVKLQKIKTSKKSMWPSIAKELNTGRSDLACRAKYDYMQRKGHRFAF